MRKIFLSLAAGILILLFSSPSSLKAQQVNHFNAGAHGFAPIFPPAGFVTGSNFGAPVFPFSGNRLFPSFGNRVPPIYQGFNNFGPRGNGRLSIQPWIGHPRGPSFDWNGAAGGFSSGAGFGGFYGGGRHR